MICMVCNNDLAACVCPELRQRALAIVESGYVLIGPDYLRRILEQADRQSKNPQIERTE